MTKEMEKTFKDQMARTFQEDIELLSEIASADIGANPKIDVAADSGAVQAQKILENLIGSQFN